MPLLCPQEEREELRSLLCPWATHDMMLGVEMGPAGLSQDWV